MSALLPADVGGGLGPKAHARRSRNGMSCHGARDNRHAIEISPQSRRDCERRHLFIPFTVLFRLGALALDKLGVQRTKANIPTAGHHWTGSEMQFEIDGAAWVAGCGGSSRAEW